jgi:putative ABC transport system permease protein
MDQLLRDLRLAVRLLRRRGAFSGLAVAILALAIGATSAIFSVLEGVLLRKPPFEEPDRLVLVWERNTVRGRDRNVVGPYNYTRWRERARTFADLAAFSAWQVNLTGDGGPERVDAGLATGNLFAVLGSRPLLGRTLADDDSRPGAPGVAVVSEGLWKRRLGGDPAVVGRPLTVNGRLVTVVGVMPASFPMPPGAAIWLPITIDDEARNARGRWMIVVGRLKPETTLAQARDEMGGLAADLARENADFNTGWTTSVYPLHADLVRDVRPALLVLMGAVGLLLLVACANVANLLLARAVTRQREVAIRSSLGASPGRLVRQLLTESLLLAGAGGIAGLVLASWVLNGLVSMLPAEVRLATPIGLNPSVVAFTALVSLLTAVVFGLVPALQQARPSPVPSLKEGGGVRGVSHGQRRLKNALVVAEVALSLVLAAGTGVLLRSFWNLTRVDPGFDARGVMSVRVDLPRNPYGDPARQRAFYRDAVERLSRIPGVTAAGGMSWTPLSRGSATSFHVLDRPVPPPGQRPAADVRIVTPGLFRTMGIPLRAGRDFREDDTEQRPRVVIVNRWLADQFWPGQDPLGKRLSMSWGEDIEAEVVGVVGDVRFASLDTPPRAALYWPVSQLPNGFMTLMARTAGPPEALTRPIRAALAAVDPELPPGPFRTLDEVIAGSLERQRFLTRLLGAFAALSLLLAAVGVYGVTSYAVVERVPEVGVRLAVGASPGDVVRLILKDGARLGLAGVGIGLLGAIAAAGLLGGLLFEVGPRDPASLAAVGALLFLATLAAAWLPARRAGRVDPIRALRVE